MKQQAIDINKFRLKDNHEIQGYVDGWNKALDVISGELQTLGDGWISVDDRLPKIPDNDYLVAVKNKNKEDGIFILDIGVFSSDGVWGKSNTWEDVTHWMSLPLPPVTK